MMNTSPKVNSNSAMCPLWCTRRSPHTSIAAPIAPHSTGAIDQGRPEADPAAEFVGEIGAEHVDAGMGEVQHAHHAEDQRKAARQHEQQHAVDQTIQQGDQTDLHGITKPLSLRAERSNPGRTVRAPSDRDCFVAALLAMTSAYDEGRFILQVVGSVSSATVVFASVFQPRPVFSTSFFTSLVNTAS